LAAVFYFLFFYVSGLFFAKLSKTVFCNGIKPTTKALQKPILKGIGYIYFYKNIAP